ncbi:MAG: hypothetical protein OQK04_15130, partial [Kangiellaceae bacterium]|nr:hypothetical protein [Kangiellaceae bacterium]
MFNSNQVDLNRLLPVNLKLILVTTLSLVMFGCATSQQSVKDTAHEQVENQSEESTAEGITEQTQEQVAEAQAKQLEQQKVALLTAKQDPMKNTVAPLELIKGYDQVKAFIESKNTSKAIEHLSKLQMEHQKFSGPSYRLARIYLDQKNYVEAL